MTETKNSPEQEIKNAQPNPSASLGDLPSSKDSMEEVVTDGALVTTEITPTEQGSDAQALVDASPTKPSTELAKGTIYNLSYLMSKGFKFGRLSINRNINEAAVKTKMKSIRVAGGVICPCLVVTARQCLKAGLGVLRSDGTKVAKGDSDVDMILVIIDGQHRNEAVKRLNGILKKGESPYECFYYLPLTSKFSIIDILREANVATKPWKGGDYLTNLIVSAPTEIDCEMLLWVQACYNTCGDVASWLWATLDPSRVYLKATLVKASKKEELLKKVADKTDFEFGRKLYDVAHSKLSVDLVKLKIVPLTVIEIMKKLTATTNKREASEKICTFINSLTKEQVKELQECKRDETLTKDQQIESKMMAYWEKFSETN